MSEKKFEYDTDKYLHEYMERGSIKEGGYFLERGNRGWELVSVVLEAMGNATRYYWKREIVN